MRKAITSIQDKREADKVMLALIAENEELRFASDKMLKRLVKNEQEYNYLNSKFYFNDFDPMTSPCEDWDTGCRD